MEAGTRTATRARATRDSSESTTTGRVSARPGTAKSDGATKAAKTAKTRAAKTAIPMKAAGAAKTARAPTIGRVGVTRARAAVQDGATKGGKASEGVTAAEPGGAPRAWLMKSEPAVYSIEDLERDGETGWEGVRNYQARNFMRDAMRPGDLVLFYHSNADPPGIAGLARVVSDRAEPDPTQFDPSSAYYDASSRPDDPRWSMVRVGFVERFAQLLPLDRLREEPALSGMALLQRGQRLSVQPVTQAELRRVLELAGARTKV